jgi:16S rRNA (guanine527-N7)-methyltransferase
VALSGGRQDPRVRQDPRSGSLSRQREPLPTRIKGLPELPPAYAAALEPALAELGLDIDTAARAAIDGHVRLLLAWTGWINLTAIREPGAIATGHVADSLAALPLVRQAGVRSLLDLGSGGGFPGLTLAIALSGIRVALVEAVRKKAAFLRTVVAALGLEDRVTVISERSEVLAHDPGHRERWDVVTARAVAVLPELIELSLPLLAPGGRLIAWKGAVPGDELEAAERALRALGGGRIEVERVPVAALGDHRLVVVTKHGHAPASFPRDPATRRRHGW